MVCIFVFQTPTDRMLPSQGQPCLGSSDSDSTDQASTGSSSEEEMVATPTGRFHVAGDTSALPRAVKRRKAYQRRRRGSPTTHPQPPFRRAAPQVHAQGS